MAAGRIGSSNAMGGGRLEGAFVGGLAGRMAVWGVLAVHLSYSMASCLAPISTLCEIDRMHM